MATIETQVALPLNDDINKQDNFDDIVFDDVWTVLETKNTDRVDDIKDLIQSALKQFICH